MTESIWPNFGQNMTENVFTSTNVIVGTWPKVHTNEH